MKSTLYVALLALAVCACSGNNDNTKTESPIITDDTVAPPAPTDDTVTAEVTPPAPEPDAGPPPPPPPPPGTDFIDHAKILFRIAACGSDEELDEKFNKKVVDSHCKTVHERFATYKKKWADVAAPFIAELRPDDLPETIVYPFGGGDLSSALVVFPDAREITTLSLEAAGDPRTVDSLDAAGLKKDLKVIGHNVGRLFRSAHSTTKSLQASSHSTIPGTLVFALSALAVHGYEPLSLRYFQIEDDGSLTYLTEEELDAEIEARKHDKDDKEQKYKTRQHWRKQEAVFANLEMKIRKVGHDHENDIITYRHIVANLDDPHLTEDGRVIKHLEAKGKVAFMTKAASFLLWYPEFSVVRDYIIEHLVWMISDASGLPPSFAEPAGFEQITYGKFTKPYFIRDPEGTRKQFIKLWKNNPYKKLPFRFGYPDGNKNSHMMITRPKQG